MTRAQALVLVTVFAGACSSPPPERTLIDVAATALGGADRIRSLKAIALTGSGSAPNAGQNRMPDDELPVWKVTEFTRTIDLANSRTRVRQLREAQFQFAGATVQRTVQGLDGDVAYNATPDGTMTRAGYFEGHRLMVSHSNEYRAPSEGEKAAIDELMKSVKEGEGRSGGPAPPESPRQKP